MAQAYRRQRRSGRPPCQAHSRSPGPRAGLLAALLNDCYYTSLKARFPAERKGAVPRNYDALAIVATRQSLAVLDQLRQGMDTIPLLFLRIEPLEDAQPARRQRGGTLA